MRWGALALLACALHANAHDDEHRPVPRIPPVAPWLTGADLLRKLNTPADNASAADYIKGVHDATERRDWCYRSPDRKPIVKPRPADMLEMMRAALAALPPAQLQRNAADLLRQVWEEKWVCPPDGCCDE
jgi:hypothetical protein